MNEVFQRRVDAWLAEDVDAYLACWHDDMVLTLPGGRVVEGIDAYRRLVEGSFAWAAPVSFDVHAVAVDGSCVLADWRGLSICELRDAKIAWWREHHLAPPLPVH